MALLRISGPYDRARSLVGAVNGIRILHGVYGKFTVPNDW